MTRLFSVFGDSISTYEGFEPASDYAVFYQEENQRRAGISSPEQTWWMQVIRGFGGPASFKRRMVRLRWSMAPAIPAATATIA